MRKFALLIAAFILSLNLCACACNNMDTVTDPTPSAPTTQTDNTPSESMIIPTPETNIPDPSTNNGNESMLPDETPGNTTNDHTGTTGTTGDMK